MFKHRLLTSSSTYHLLFQFGTDLLTDPKLKLSEQEQNGMLVRHLARAMLFVLTGAKHK